MKRLTLSAFALATALLALPSAGCSQETQSDKVFGERVRAYLLRHPEVIQQAIDALQTKTQAMADQAARGAILTHHQQLVNDPNDFVANPNGKITVVEFFDYKCTYCKASADQVVDLIHKNPDVRFVFKEFPILSDTSTHAAQDQLLVRSQGHYLQTFQALMHQPGLNDESATQIIRENGADVARADTPATRAAVDRHIADNKDLAHAIGVDGTPAFVVGDRLISGYVPEDLQAGIDAQRRGGGGSGQP